MTFRTVFRNYWAPVSLKSAERPRVELMTAGQGWIVILLLLVVVVELWWFLPNK